MDRQFKVSRVLVCRVNCRGDEILGFGFGRLALKVLEVEFSRTMLVHVSC